jgi:hypothetical protein
MMDSRLRSFDRIFEDSTQGTLEGLETCRGNIFDWLLGGQVTGAEANELDAHAWALYKFQMARAGRLPYTIPRLHDDHGLEIVCDQRGPAVYQQMLIDNEAGVILSSCSVFGVSNDGTAMQYWVSESHRKCATPAGGELVINTSARPIKSFAVALENGLVMTFERQGFMGGATEEEIDSAKAKAGWFAPSSIPVHYPRPTAFERLPPPTNDPKLAAMLDLAAICGAHEEWSQAIHNDEAMAKYCVESKLDDWRAAVCQDLERIANIVYEQGKATLACRAFELAFETFAVEPPPPGHWLPYARVLGGAGQGRKGVTILYRLLEILEIECDPDEALLAAVHFDLGNLLDHANDQLGRALDSRARRAS